MAYEVKFAANREVMRREMRLCSNFLNIAIAISKAPHISVGNIAPESENHPPRSSMSASGSTSGVTASTT